MNMDKKTLLGYQLSVELTPDLAAIHSQMMDVHGNIQRQVLQLKEAMTRKALIKAGWTPPSQKPTENRTMYACSHCGFLYGEKVTRCDCMPEGQEQRFDEWVARPKSETPSLLQAVLRCRYPVDTRIRSEGYNWDTPRLDDVINDAMNGEY